MVNFSHIGRPATDHLTYKYSFATGSSDALMGSAMALYASIKGYHKIALAFDASVGAQTLVPSIMKAAQVLGLTVVASPAIPLGAPSYEAEVLQIMQAHPDVILTQLQPSLAGTFFQELVTLWRLSATVYHPGSDLNAGNLPGLLQAYRRRRRCTSCR